ncbi:hypothetical protein C0J52_27367 [Blattella germanica]|nr:hypothetical protein C0J52_27367 [Blattella germanica]
MRAHSGGWKARTWNLRNSEDHLRSRCTVRRVPTYRQVLPPPACHRPALLLITAAESGLHITLLEHNLCTQVHKSTRACY